MDVGRGFFVLVITDLYRIIFKASVTETVSVFKSIGVYHISKVNSLPNLNGIRSDRPTDRSRNKLVLRRDHNNDYVKNQTY